MGSSSDRRLQSPTLYCVAMRPRVTLTLFMVALASASCRLLRLQGDLAVWTDTRGGGPLYVTVDTRPVGTLDRFFTAGAPTCGPSDGVVLSRVTSGIHRIAARDSSGRVWKGEVLVQANGCTLVRLAPRGVTRENRIIPADSMGTTSHR